MGVQSAAVTESSSGETHGEGNVPKTTVVCTLPFHDHISTCIGRSVLSTPSLGEYLPPLTSDYIPPGPDSVCMVVYH